ncbi:MAG: DUF881 domain-containing protein [Nostocoides sp.]
MSTAGHHESNDGPWQRLRRMGRPRATRAMLLAFLLMVGLGFALATQVRQTSNSGLTNLREDELVRILDNVQQDNERLGNEIRALETTRDRLTSGQASAEEARKAAQLRVTTLGILAGTVAATGPGIVITINDPDDIVTAPVLLDTLEELRDAGAEAIQMDDQRVVTSSYFTDAESGGVTVSGTPLKKPYTIVAIGDPNTLAAAMGIPGGISETVRSLGASIRIEQRDVVNVSALQALPADRYAQPVPPSPATTP